MGTQLAGIFSVFDLIAQVVELPDGYYLADDEGPFYSPEISMIPEALTLPVAMEVCGRMTELGFDALRVVHLVSGVSRNVVVMARV